MRIKFFDWLFNLTTNFLALFSRNDEQREISVAANFVFNSEPVGSEIVRVWIADCMYDGEVSESGAVSMRLPCNRSIELTFGDDFQFSQEIFIPCHRNTFFIGVYDWNKGNIL